MAHGLTTPPRPANSYILFRQHVNNEIVSLRQGLPGLAQKDVSIFTSSLWHLLPPNVKNHFRRKAKEAEAQHKSAYPGYRYSPQRKKGLQKNCSPEKRKLYYEKPTDTSKHIGEGGDGGIAPANTQTMSASLPTLSASSSSRARANQGCSQPPYPIPLPVYLVPVYSFMSYSNPVSCAFLPLPLVPQSVQAAPYLLPHVQGQGLKSSPDYGPLVSPFAGTANGLTIIDRSRDIHEPASIDYQSSETEDASSSSRDGSVEEGSDFSEDDINQYFRFSEFQAE